MKKILTWLTVFIFVNHLYAQTGSRGVDVAHTKDTTVFNGTIYAVIVGVSDYKYVHPLSFADKDAELFWDFLQSKSGGSVKRDNMLLIEDSDASVSTLPTINRWLTKTKKFQKGDRVYFYFAGHGDAISPHLVYFLLQDCNPAGDKNNYLGSMASVIDMYTIKSLITDELIKNGIDVVLIWDACRTNENELPGGETGQENMQQGIAEKSDGESIMLSTSADEVALESSIYANGHGLFTYYLIDGLSGAADKPENGGNGDGKVDMRELQTWVAMKVRVDAYSKFNKAAQNPRFIYSGDETLSVVDSAFENEWALAKTSGEDIALNYKNISKGAGREVQEADTAVIKLYNQFMESLKADSLDNGPTSAEGIYNELLNKYPDNSLTDQAGFNLAMEYINQAQDKINLYLSGKDDLTILATSKVKNEDHDDLNKTQIISSGKNYGKNAQYLNRAITLLKKDTIADLEYIKQLQAKADFLMSRSYVSNEGIVTNFSKALQLAKAALSVQPKAAYNYLLFGSLFYINKQYDSSIFYLRKAVSLAPNWVNAITNLGLAFDTEKKTDSARYYYRKAIAINPDFLVPYANLSYSFSSQNSFDSAYKYGRKAVELNPLYAGGINTLGIIFHFQKMYDSAKVYYYKAISIDPKYVNAYDNLGLLFYNEKMYDSSKAYFLKTINVNPQYTDGYYDLAVVFESQKQYDSAKEYYYKTLSINPKYADAYNGLGNIFQDHLKLPDSAKVYYHKAISIDPKATYAYYNLGILFYSQSEYDSAMYYYKRALDIDPKYTYAYNNLGLLFYNQKQYDSAAMYYRKSLQIDPEYTDAYNNLGSLFYNQKQYDSAAMYYRKSLQIDPKYTNAYNNLGLLFYNQKQYDSAAMYYRKTLQIDPKYTNAYNNLGLLFDNQKQYDSANFYYREALSIDPDNTNAYNELGNIFMNDHQYDSAMQYFNKSISIDPHFTAAVYNLGLLFASQNQFDSSMVYFHKAIGMDHSYTIAYVGMGNIFTNEKMFDSAKIYYHKAIGVDPSSSNAYVGLANIFTNERIFDSAKIYYHRAISSNPNYPEAYYNLGYLFFMQKQYDSTKYYYYKTITTDSGYAAVYNGLGNLFMNEQMVDSAKIYYRKAINTDPKYPDANYNLGLLFANQNQFDSAKYYLHESININPKYVFGYVGIGNIFFKQKEYDSAMMYYRTAIGLDSSNLNTYYSLSACLVLKKGVDSSASILKRKIKDKIVDASTFGKGIFISNYYQDKKSYDKEIDITQLLYNYDSVYHISGVDSSLKAYLLNNLVLNNLAYAYLFNGQTDQSKYYYAKAGALSYFYYNAACLASLNKKTNEALENLETSFQNGFSDFDHIQEDTDLDNIRNTNEFKQLLKKYFPGKAK